MKKINKYTAASMFFGLAMTFASCGNESFDLPTPPGQPEGGEVAMVQLSNALNAEQATGLIAKNGQDAQIKLKLSLPAPEGGYTPTLITNSTALAGYVTNYAKTLGISALQLLPEDAYEVKLPTIAQGEKEGTIEVNIKDWEKMPYGTFYLPVVVQLGGLKTPFFVKVFKDGEYVALSKENQKPLPPGYESTYSEPVKMIAFVETNDWNPLNMGQFILEKSKLPVFDYIVFFAPNMNYDETTGEPYVFFNDKLEPMVNNPDIYIKPLTDRGIKVLFEILPNHQGVGYRNFQSYEDAKNFAEKCKYWTDKLGISGWDIDEEYAEYDKCPERPRNSNSGYWYCKAMKEVMPDKELTLYNFNSPVSGNVAPYIDFVFANYGESWMPSWCKRSDYAGYSIECNWGISEFNFSRAAGNNLNDKNGGLMIFALHGPDIASGKAAKAISGATKKFYGESTIFSGAYQPGPRG